MTSNLQRCGPVVLGVLAACHETYDSGPSPPSSEAQGLWWGTLTTAGGGSSQACLIVTPYGDAFWMTVDATGTPVANTELQGSLATEAGVVSGALYRSSPLGLVAVDVTGTVDERWSLELGFAGGGLYDGASASLFFDPIYETDSRVRHVEGAWSRGGLALSISSDGAINGVDGSGGTYSGTIFTPWTKVDVYRVDVVASHPADPWPYHYQGVATLLADGSLLLTCEGFASWLSPARYWSPRLFR